MPIISSDIMKIIEEREMEKKIKIKKRAEAEKNEEDRTSIERVRGK